MNDDTEDDLPTQLTRLLRNVDGVHTVYATKPILPSIFGAIVEAVRSDKVGMHLITIDGQPDDLTITACIGVTGSESAFIICRRAHDALRGHFTSQNQTPPISIRVKIGRVG